MTRRIARRRAAYAVVAVLTLAGMAPAYAQTQGMERRDDRRHTRQGSRAAKQDCKAGDEKTRAECRHEKRDTKQDARHGKTAPPATQ